MRLRTLIRALCWILLAALTVFAVGAIQFELPGWRAIGLGTAAILALLAITISRRTQTR